MRLGTQGWVFLLVSLILCLFLGYEVDRSDTSSLILAFTGLFVAYFWYGDYALGGENQNTGSWFSKLLAMAMLLRLIFLVAYPALSDDYFRFIWDGKMLVEGINPYLVLPKDDYASLSSQIPGLSALFEGMNSPQYYTIYPPILQAWFGLSALISPNSVLGSIVVLRAFILIAEFGTIVLIRKILQLLNLDERNVFWYAFNPLVIIELTGNLHPEALMIFFLALGIYWLLNGNLMVSSFFWACAISSKIIPLIFLPYFIVRYGWLKAVKYYLIIFVTIATLSIPFVGSSLIENFYSSLNLYFQSFEFNASLYYLVGYLGKLAVGYNIIQWSGPVLSLIAFVIILLLLMRPSLKTNTNPHKLFLFALTTYLIFATTVHPWYISTLVFLNIFVQRLRYAYVWSALAVLSYVHYYDGGFQERMWVIALEYTTLLIWVAYEVSRSKREERMVEVHK